MLDGRIYTLALPGGEQVSEPRKYAEGTSVEVTKSKADIERLVTNHGATGFMTAWDGSAEHPQSLVVFRLNGRMLKYVVKLPAERGYRRDPRGRPRKPAQVQSYVEAEHRRRWRALFLIIKAKLELVAASERDDAFDREFLCDIMLPNGQVAGDVLVPQVAASYETGAMPKLLPGGD